MLAALDPADIASIKTRFVGQTLLRQPELAALGANAFPENVQIRVHLSKSLESGVSVHGV